MAQQTSQPLTLPCGLTLPNRLCKAAMAENMAEKKGLPGAHYISSYGAWAKGGWGLVLTGNVQVDQRHLGQPADVVYNDALPREQMLASWRAWAEACRRHDTPTLVQINHPGRQSTAGSGDRGLFEKTVAPSAVPLDFGNGIAQRLASALVFGTPRAMTATEVEDVVHRFAETARLSAEAGFDGVEIHSAHGYLLAQFLSERSNLRTDEYGGTPAKRARIVVDIIRAIRAATPKGFCVGIKLNSVDHQAPGEFDACLEQLALIAEAGIDFVEISGGTYEDPTMMLSDDDPRRKAASASTVSREAFFLEFAQAIRKHVPQVPLMVTGGFRSRAGMEDALASGACDIIGMARPAVVSPQLPLLLLDPNTADEDAKIVAPRSGIRDSFLVRWLGLKTAGAGAETTWYGSKIKTMR